MKGTPLNYFLPVFLFCVALTLPQLLLGQRDTRLTFTGGAALHKTCFQVGAIPATYEVSVEVTPGDCGAGNYQLSWGDGTAPVTLSGLLETETFTHSYNISALNTCATGFVERSIVLTNIDDNCFELKAAVVRLNKLPEAAINITAACEGRNSTFINATCGRTNISEPVSWKWEFSDNRAPITTLNASVRLTDPNTTYTVKLTATSKACGAEYTTSATQSFQLNKLPTASATVAGLDDDLFCFRNDTDSTLRLDASASANTTTFEWRIRGGEYDYEEVARADSAIMSIKLKEDQPYTIDFTAKNECGSAPQTFTWDFEAVAAPEISLIPHADGCESLDYRILNKVEGAVYTLNDVVFNPDEVQHLEISDDPYIVTANISNRCGQHTASDTVFVYSKEPVIITSLPPDTIICYGSTPLPLLTNLPGGTWENASEQDINGQTVFYPNQTGEFNVTYKRGTGLCLSSDSRIVNVINTLAEARIGLDQLEARCSPAQLLFSNRSEGSEVGYSVWDFGDGTSDIFTSSDTISHVFIAEDVIQQFVVQLQVRNACGVSQDQRTIQIIPSSLKPLFTLASDKVCKEVDLQFTDATVPSPSAWKWDFGDGTIANIANPVHRFTGNPGSYNVKLVVSNQCATDSIVHQVAVTPPPTGDFSIDYPLVCSGEEIKITNATDPSYKFIWNFGDGSDVDSVNFMPRHTYSEPGSFPVQLTVYQGTLACKSEIRKTVLIDQPLEADFAIEVAPEACSPALVKFVNLTEGSDQWLWEFDDGRTTTVKEPLMPFREGPYTIKLTAKKNGGCESVAEKATYLDLVDCGIDIPEAFTPNGDKHGDRYTLFGNGIQRIQFLKIRNRWGQVVFEMRDVPPGSQEPGESWDGTMNGKDLPADMYVFESKIIYRDQTESDIIKGKFYLVR